MTGAVPVPEDEDAMSTTSTRRCQPIYCPFIWLEGTPGEASLIFVP